MAIREERQRHRLDVPVERATQRRDDALADGGHEIGLAVARHAFHHVRTEQQEGDQRQHRDVAPDEDAVHGRLHQPGDRALHRRHHKRKRTAEQQNRQVGLEMDEQPAVDRDAGADQKNALTAAAIVSISASVWPAEIGSVRISSTSRSVTGSTGGAKRSTAGWRWLATG